MAENKALASLVASEGYLTIGVSSNSMMTITLSNTTQGNGATQKHIKLRAHEQKSGRG